MVLFRQFAEQNHRDRTVLDPVPCPADESEEKSSPTHKTESEPDRHVKRLVNNLADESDPGSDINTLISRDDQINLD